MREARVLESGTYVGAARESITDLLGDLVGNSAALVRDELALARCEVSDKITGLRPGILLVAVGAVISLGSLLTLSAAAVIALAPAIGWPASALVIGLALGLVSMTVILIGVNKIRRLNLAPAQTIETLIEDKEWLKQLT